MHMIVCTWRNRKISSVCLTTYRCRKDSVFLQSYYLFFGQVSGVGRQYGRKNSYLQQLIPSNSSTRRARQVEVQKLCDARPQQHHRFVCVGNLYSISFLPRVGDFDSFSFSRGTAAFLGFGKTNIHQTIVWQTMHWTRKTMALVVALAYGGRMASVRMRTRVFHIAMFCSPYRQHLILLLPFFVSYTFCFRLLFDSRLWAEQLSFLLPRRLFLVLGCDVPDQRFRLSPLWIWLIVYKGKKESI